MHLPRIDLNSSAVGCIIETNPFFSRFTVQIELNALFNSSILSSFKNISSMFKLSFFEGSSWLSIQLESND